MLADALWWTKENVKPKFMINLATLTGAIIVALGVENAGLFSNDDELVDAAHRGRQGDGRDGVADADGARLRQADRFEIRRHEELRRAPRRVDHRGAFPQALRRRHAMGASRHRGHRDGLAGRRRPTRPGARAGACACSTGSSPIITRNARRPDEVDMKRTGLGRRAGGWRKCLRVAGGGAAGLRRLLAETAQRRGRYRPRLFARARRLARPHQRPPISTSRPAPTSTAP